jgi:hypothetical protein
MIDPSTLVAISGPDHAGQLGASAVLNSIVITGYSAEESSGTTRARRLFLRRDHYGGLNRPS